MSRKIKSPLEHEAFQDSHPEKAMEAITTMARETGLDLTRSDDVPEVIDADALNTESTRRRDTRFVEHSRTARLGRSMTLMSKRLGRK